MFHLIRCSSYSIFLFSDPYAHIKEYVVKVANENGFSCTICGKKCRDMYLMREHIEGLHDLSPGHLCGGGLASLEGQWNFFTLSILRIY